MAISNALLTLLKNTFKATMGVTPKQFSSKSFLVNKGGNALNFLFDEFKQRILSYKKGTGLNVDMYQFMNSKEYQMAMGENLAKVYHTFKPDTFVKLAEEMKM
ncbi:MAG: hypothetical protein HUJ61_04955 [Bacilli bacterium]|nr:hypothetical protein [Bacilli bacterium]